MPKKIRRSEKRKENLTTVTTPKVQDKPIYSGNIVIDQGSNLCLDNFYNCNRFAYGLPFKKLHVSGEKTNFQLWFKFQNTLWRVSQQI